MVRLALLAVLVAACLAAAPAAQADLPVDVQSTATAAVAQVQTEVATVTTPVRPAAGQVSATTTVPAATPDAGSATELAKPAVEPAEYTTAAAVSVISDDRGDPQAAAPRRSAHFRRQGRGHTGSSAARRGPGAALARPHATAPAPAPAADPADRAPRATGSGSKDRPAPPDRVPSTPQGGPASAPAAGLALGGLALLAVAVSLAGPHLRRRLLIKPAVLRPVAFVSLLERPG
jgi:hypothetical protein